PHRRAPLANRAFPTRGFLPWRLFFGRRPSSPHPRPHQGRRPKPFTQVDFFTHCLLAVFLSPGAALCGLMCFRRAASAPTGLTLDCAAQVGSLLSKYWAMG